MMAKAKKKSAPISSKQKLTTIYLLSDSTGNLAQHMLTAFLTQFPARTFDIRRYNFLNSTPKLEDALADLEASPGMVLHAFVDSAAKSLIDKTCARLSIPARDLTGGFVEFLSTHSGIAPNPDVKKLHDLTDEYRARIKALEFTLEHDDGLGIDTIHEADIVLAGVSRTSKTPTSIYLAQQGYKVANVSLAMAVKPPVQLLNLNKPTVVGLLIDPLRLHEIRTNRQAAWGMGDTNYNDMSYIEDEVAWSRKLFNSKGWPTLDVTRRAVEESAQKIIDLLKVGKS
jgi:regulator of PEP synthase PpsR (kinase-PPPase family)